MNVREYRARAETTLPSGRRLKDFRKRMIAHGHVAEPLPLIAEKEIPCPVRLIDLSAILPCSSCATGSVFCSTMHAATEMRCRTKMGKRNFFLFSHPDAVREVLVTQSDAFSKGVVMQRAQSFLGEGLLTSEGDFHRRQRRIIQPVFHPQRMASYSPIIVDYAKRAVDR